VFKNCDWSRERDDFRLQSHPGKAASTDLGNDRSGIIIGRGTRKKKMRRR
jgi:hypothetical protein